MPALFYLATIACLPACTPVVAPPGGAATANPTAASSVNSRFDGLYLGHSLRVRAPFGRATASCHPSRALSIKISQGDLIYVPRHTPKLSAPVTEAGVFKAADQYWTIKGRIADEKLTATLDSPICGYTLTARLRRAADQ